MFILKKNTDNKSKYDFELPFSKQTVEFARWESYLVTILLFVFAWFEKDIGSLIVLGTLFIGGYRLVQSSYLKMAREEHLLDMKIRAKESGVDDQFIEEELERINDEANSELDTSCDDIS